MRSLLKSGPCMKSPVFPSVVTGNKILVVDDNPDALKATRRILETAGYEVMEADTGRACLALLQENHPDLVLLDIILPDMDGLEVCRQIKTSPALEHLFIILMSSAQISSHQQALGLESGADGYIARPISNLELVARVQALLRIRQKDEALRQSEERYRSLLNDIAGWLCPLSDGFRRSRASARFLLS